MKTAGLGKSHKLCSATAIERLFDGRGSSSSMLAYPIRAVWAEGESVQGSHATERVKFMISVPKKRVRHAVDRVKMRRRVREAYRLARPRLVPPLSSDAATPVVHLAFLYVGNGIEPYERVRKAMERILRKMFQEQ
ncbi:MAG: ribonuclease P protein component [Bacteroidales bacterium]|nr:ribonuclease P protein component [Bacteroidales bacterium]